jgi:hypothetical protein
MCTKLWSADIVYFTYFIRVGMHLLQRNRSTDSLAVMRLLLVLVSQPVRGY